MAACSASPVISEFQVREVAVGSETLRVLVASTTEERSTGLSGVADLPTGVAGMLFEFDGPQAATFTMEDTVIPLDLWWFDSEGLVIGHTMMAPCVGSTCVDYRSPGPVLWALETRQGEFQFVPGDRLTNVESE